MRLPVVVPCLPWFVKTMCVNLYHVLKIHNAKGTFALMANVRILKYALKAQVAVYALVIAVLVKLVVPIVHRDIHAINQHYVHPMVYIVSLMSTALSI